MSPIHRPWPALILTCAVLTACGGGDDPAAPPAGGGGGGTEVGGLLTLSESKPAANNGVIDLATATTVINEARAPDGAFAFNYCAITFEGATSDNGGTYSVQVYFRQSNGKVINANVADSTYAWVVGEVSATGAITGITVDAAARTITYTAKSLDAFGDTTLESTLDGTITFPANDTVAACGA